MVVNDSGLYIYKDYSAFVSFLHKPQLVIASHQISSVKQATMPKSQVARCSPSPGDKIHLLLIYLKVAESTPKLVQKKSGQINLDDERLIAFSDNDGQIIKKWKNKVKKLLPRVGPKEKNDDKSQDFEESKVNKPKQKFQ